MKAPARGGRRSDEYNDVVERFAELAELDRADPRRALVRDQIITRCLPLAAHIAQRFSGRGEAADDLMQVARIGLVNAVDRFDPHCGSAFLAFAIPTITGEVRRYFRDAAWALKVPRRMKELHSELAQATRDLSQALGRAPTISELARHLDRDPAEISEGLQAGQGYKAMSLDVPAGAGNDQLPLVDVLGDYDRALEAVEDHESLRPLLMGLSERDRTIVLLRFFDNCTQTQIAERLGISQMHVSRILARTLATLRTQMQD
ncbi:SigB/SigF/SigG family RNA polymerase sigma factor [Antrihabitans sp. YC2-6]|uniref:SigB/SigF/SigG family RNA polymerase sigma factor n=1 Tax=Antrihabitans sp. YC2-6 TaxID=2799498 RepID=UPI0035A98268